MSPVLPQPERPWLATCTTCGWEQRCATRPGAVVYGEAHAARRVSVHAVKVVHAPLGGDPDAAEPGIGGAG